jgi:hypothetical protein
MRIKTKNLHDLAKKSVFVCLLISILISFSSIFFFSVKKAKAQWAVFDTPLTTITVSNEIKRTTEKRAEDALGTGIAMASVNALKVFSTMIAQKAANLAASGMMGQKPAFHTEQFGQWLTDAADAAAGDFVENTVQELGKEFELNIPAGLICEGPEIKLEVAFALLSPGAQQPRRPNCSFSELSKAWDLTDPDVLSKIEFGYRITGEGQNSLDAAINLFQEQADRAEAARAKKKLKREESGTMKNSEHVITKTIKTPATFLDEEFKQGMVRKPDGTTEVYGNPVYDAMNVFSSTLISRLMQKIVVEGLVNLGDLAKKKDSGDGVSKAVQDLLDEAGTGSGYGGNRAASENLLSEKISVASIYGAQSNYDLISQMVACPSDTKSINLYNCTLSNDFRVAIEAKDGEHLTLEQAVDQDILNPNLPFGYSSPAQGIEPTINEGYPFSAILKLRKVRIVPVGWEIAGRLIKARTEVKTLFDLMQEFDERGEDGICNPWTDDTDSPYCNLIDPAWILKAPKYNCNAVRYGELFQPGSSFRHEYCVDLQDCVAEDERGRCTSYGYCTREKNVWRFGGTQCNETYNTCKGLTRIEDGETFYYLQDTLDKGTPPYECDAQNAGCSWFSLSKDENGDWKSGYCKLDYICDEQNGCLCSADTGSCTVMQGQDWCTNRIYFNGRGERMGCESDADGCTEFYRLTNIAGDRTTESILNEILENKDDFQNLGAEQAYYYYADISPVYLKINKNILKEENEQFCEKEYAGCERYTPVNGDPSITAMVNEGDYCPAECVGYDTYVQKETYFENRKQNIDFIPNTARKCSAKSVGCEGFTNLDAVERGGEQVEYFSFLRQCRGFDEEYTKTYFYWQGTESGYQLNRVSLVKGEPLKGEQGEPPRYIEGFDDFDLCNKEVFDSKENAYCLELFDSLGNRWYRLIPFTISSPNPDFYENGVIPFERSCHRYRKNPDISGGVACQLTEVCDNPNGCQCITDNISCVVSEGEKVCTKGGEVVCKLRDEEGNLRFCDDPNGCSCSLGDMTCQVKYNEDACSSDRSCVETGGRWINGYCRYQAIPAEGIRCTDSQVGCKSYKGAGSGSERLIIKDMFEDTELDENWTTSSDIVDIRRSATAVQFGGHSLKFQESLIYDLTEKCSLNSICKKREGCRCITKNSNICTVARNQLSCTASYLSQASSYVIDLLAKNDDTANNIIRVKLADSVDSNGLILGELKTTNTQWHKETLGPLIFEQDPLAYDKLIIEVYGVDDAGNRTGLYPDNTYVDNIILRQERESYYLIENSWKTPSNCETDPPLQGGIASSSMLGCKEYANRFGQSVYLKNFSQLCPSNKVGCEALINTQNSDSPYQKTYNKNDLSQITVPQDTVEYVINTEDYYCLEEQKGCRELGVAVLNQDNEPYECRLDSVCESDVCECSIDYKGSCKVDRGEQTCSIWKKKYILNNPNDYDNHLCTHPELKCEEFSDEDTLYYFKDPKDQVCVFTKVPGTTPAEYAWFKFGEVEAGKENPPECICEYKKVPFEDPSRYAWYVRGQGIPDHPLCAGLTAEDLVWANVCPASQDGCTKFVEPSNCEYRPGVCYLPIIGGETTPVCDRTMTDIWSPERGGCSCDNGQIQCYINEGERYCIEEPDWYQKREFPICELDSVCTEPGGCVCSDNNNTECLVILGETLCTNHPYEVDKKCVGYYYLNNEQIDRRSCNGRVDWKGECVLFNDTSDPILSYTSFDDYNINTVNDPQSVPACNSEGRKVGRNRCDTNVVLKVKKDRECGEWLACQTSMRRWDALQNKVRETCFNTGRCVKYDPTVTSQCSIWDRPMTSDKLTKEVYQSRDITWDGYEYSGYSIYNMYPVDLFKQRAGKWTEWGNPNDFRLTYIEKAYSNTVDGSDTCVMGANQCPGEIEGETRCNVYDIKNNVFRCEIMCSNDKDCVTAKNNGVFAKTSNRDPYCAMTSGPGGNTFGRCMIEVGIDNKGSVLDKSCRGYPEQDSPIPYDYNIIEWYKDEDGTYFTRPRFKDAEVENINVAFEDNYADCSYRKVTYKNYEDYYFDLFAQGGLEPPLKLREEQFGEAEGSTINRDYKQKMTKYFYGWRGYCLENDPSRRIYGKSSRNPCLTWWPVDLIRGEVDYLNNAWDSYWVAQPGREYYCSNGELYEGRQGGDRCGMFEEYDIHVGDIDLFDWGDSKCADEFEVYDDNYEVVFRDYEKHDYILVTQYRIRCGIGVKNKDVFDANDDGLGGRVADCEDEVKKHEELILGCTQLSKVQRIDSENESLRDSLPWSTRIRSSKFGKEQVGFLRDYPQGFKLDLGNVNYWYNTQDTIGFTPSRDSSYKHSGAKVNSPPFGASCFVKGGCETNIASSTFAEEADPVLKHTQKGNFDDVFNKLTYVNKRVYDDNKTSTVKTPPLVSRLAGERVHKDIPGDQEKWGLAPLAVENSAKGIANLKKLFVKSYGSWNWTGSEFRKSNDGWDISQQEGELPLITQVVEDQTSLIGQTERIVNGKKAIGITLNMRNNETIRGKRSLPVNLNFYAYNPNGEQMPLRRITIDWDDNTESVIIDGYIKNHKHICERYCLRPYEETGEKVLCMRDKDCGVDLRDRENKCVPWTFGDHPDACVMDTDTEPGSFSFVHVYNCLSPLDDKFVGEKMSCEFHPTVEVVDNWGMKRTITLNPQAILVEP